jgi:hypothetical protein
MNAPVLTINNNISPFPALSVLNYIQSKIGSGALPVLQGEESNPVLFRIYNNFALAAGIADALNIAMTVYDGSGAGSHTANSLPASQSWLTVMEHGFGQNSQITPDLYTRYDGIETAIGGANTYKPQKGSDGVYGSPNIHAGVSNAGAGYIEYKSICKPEPSTPGGLYNFSISLIYEYVS